MAIIADKSNATVDATQAQTDTVATTGTHSHIVRMHNAYFGLRVVQFFVAIIVLGLVGRLMAETEGITFGQEVFALITSLFTIIVILYGLIAEASLQAAYNMWAVLGLDALMTVFWLVSMAVLAALRADEHPFTIDCDQFDLCFFTGANSVYLSQLAAAAGISALEFLLFIASLVPLSMAVHKHRTSNAPSNNVQRMEMGPVVGVAPVTDQYVPPPQQPTPNAPFQHATPTYQETVNPIPPHSHNANDIPTYDGPV